MEVTKMSLSHNPTMTVLPVTDQDRAKVFYAETLGLWFIGKSPDGNLVFALDGTATLGLMEAPGGQTDHTVMSFEVTDMDDSIDDLERHGVHFEDYDTPELKTVNHVAVNGQEKAAWFKDPEGNILCLHQGAAIV
jgi:predicted enzyme related to lactoylglutathione lyase